MGECGPFILGPGQLTAVPDTLTHTCSRDCSTNTGHHSLITRYMCVTLLHNVSNGSPSPLTCVPWDTNPMGHHSHVSYGTPLQLVTTHMSPMGHHSNGSPLTCLPWDTTPMGHHSHVSHGLPLLHGSLICVPMGHNSYVSHGSPLTCVWILVPSNLQK